jgi:hypothetical protein
LAAGQTLQMAFYVKNYIGVDFENPGHPHSNEQIDVFYNGRKLPFEMNISILFSAAKFLSMCLI